MNVTTKTRSSKTRRIRKRHPFIITLLLVIVLAATVISSYILYVYLTSSSSIVEPTPEEPSAALIDHLSLTIPNRSFIAAATHLLEKAGYSVDYYPGELVTVDFYRSLPTYQYDLVILRVHSALESYEKVSPVILFTSEKYSMHLHVLEQAWGQIGAVAYSTEEAMEGKLYFGIKPSFVKEVMQGLFTNATILMMGCDGLKYSTMGEAFVQKGAKVYVGWSGSVAASHTDVATIRLIEHLITENHPVPQAIDETMLEVGRDPVDGSVLTYYPYTA